jgi:hypothetical protein
MFKEAFFHLIATDSEFPHYNLIVSLSDCQSAYAAAQQEVILTRRAYTALKYDTQSDPVNVQRALELLNDANRYIQFLNACLELLQSSGSLPITELMFQVSVLKADLQLQAEHFFAAWIGHNALEATQYYENYYDHLCGQVSAASLKARTIIILGKTLVEHELAMVRVALQYQEQPLAICRLLDELFPTPVRLAACFIWMIERQVDVSALLKTGLLHRFFAYHMNSLSVDERHDVLNPVAFMYGLLEQFDCTRSLVVLARQQACHVRGHERYNLLGEQVESLVTEQICDKFPLLTRTPENLIGVVNYFDQRAFNEIVHTLFTGAENDAFDRCVITLTKDRPHLVSPRIIQLIALEQAHELAKWVCFVDEPLFQEWLNKGELAMLYLLSQKPQWIHQVDEIMMHRFLDLIFERQKPGAEDEIMRLLMCLYQVASSANLNLAAYIYASMIDVILMHGYLIEDKHVYRVLKRSQYSDDCIETRASLIIRDWTQKVTDFFSQPLSYTQYASLRTDWQQIYNQIELLQKLKKLKCNFPQTEADLMVYLFQMYSKTPAPDWRQLVDILELDPISADDFSEYNHRALCKIFTHFDSDCVRDMIIDMYHWDQASFQGEIWGKVSGNAKDEAATKTLIRPAGKNRHLLLDAVSAGNKSVLEWFLRVEDLDDQLLLKAISTERWEWIEHWFVNYDLPQLSKKALAPLLIAIAGSERFSFLRQLLHDWSFEPKVIAQAFANASSHNNIKALYLLYLSSPAKPVLKVAFCEAVKNRHIESIAFFGGIKNRKEELANEVIRAFNKGVKDNDLELVECLSQFIGNAPSSAVVKKAMEKAIACKQQEMTSLLQRILSKFQDKRQVTEFTKSRANRNENTFFRSTQSLTHLSVYDSPVSPEP